MIRRRAASSSRSFPERHTTWSAPTVLYGPQQTELKRLPLSRQDSEARRCPPSSTPRAGCRRRERSAVRRHYDPVISEVIAFDPHRFVKRLTDSGFKERQAETLAEERVALLNGNLASRADVAKVEARVGEAKFEILMWVFGALVAQGGLIVALIKLL